MVRAAGVEPTNGSYVTWRELNLALEPLEKMVDQLDGKMDQMLFQKATADGAREVRKSLLNSTKFWVTLILTTMSGTITAVVTTILLKA